MKKIKPTHWLIAVILLLPFLLSFHARAAGASVFPPGTYPLSAALSCYVNAMGGVEFGAPLLTNAELTVTEDGSETITLHLTKSSVTIYSVTCDTFIDASPSYVTEDRGVKSGVIGYYDQDGVLRTEDVAYTLSEDTALNASNEAVHYVDSVTFPVDGRRETYALTLYINSQIMGVQFCDGSGTAGSANPDLPTPYKAVLSLDWDQMVVISLDEPEPTDAQDEPRTVTITYLPFDVDLDSAVSAADARLTLRASVGLETLAKNTPAFFAADSDGDGQITAGDARHILRASVGLELKEAEQTVSI